MLGEIKSSTTNYHHNEPNFQDSFEFFPQRVFFLSQPVRVLQEEASLKQFQQEEWTVGAYFVSGPML